MESHLLGVAGSFPSAHRDGQWARPISAGVLSATGQCIQSSRSSAGRWSLDPLALSDVHPRIDNGFSSTVSSVGDLAGLVSRLLWQSAGVGGRAVSRGYEI